MPEEVSNSNIMGGRKLQLIGELKENIPLVLSTISSFLFNPVSTEIQLKSLRCLQSWIQYGFSLEEGYPILQKVMTLLGDVDLFEAAVDVLLESMQQAAWARYQNYRNELLTCFTSDAMKEKFELCIAEEDEETARLIAKLLTTFGETYTDYIVGQLGRPDMYWLMTMILRLTGFEGFFPIDQEVAEIPLNFWYIMQETLFDECILPVKPAAPSETEELWKYNCGQAALVIYRELVEILIRNARYPEEPVWESWTKGRQDYLGGGGSRMRARLIVGIDIKDKFKTWRRDLGDTMINPFYVLRDEMLAILLDHTVYVINQWTSLPNATQASVGVE